VAEGWINHNGLRVNTEIRLCEVDGQLLDLTRSEFELLVAIMLGQRRVISKSSLALDMRGDEGGGGGYVSESDRRAVEVHLANLRRKLNDSVSSPRFIETVRGVGYRLAATRQPDGAQRGR
ncbi:MAG: winged helix-turn-helix transcriptional regulator, partial [Propionibacteriaceae bacterium]|nr:winged helix-turn-helix transcriptional regulator [Propionibacteriaceae bacterium]